MSNVEPKNRSAGRIAVLMPSYCEEKAIGGVVTAARQHVRDVIVVDDHSPDRTVELAEAAGALVIRHPARVGKGASLSEGFRFVLQQGFDAVITMNCDGFHDPAEIPKFIETYERTGLPVLIGNRMTAEGCVARCHRQAIRIMSSLLVKMLGVYVPDPPCGYRFYRCDVLSFLIMDQESSLFTEFETLLNVAKRRVRVGSVRIARCTAHRKSGLLAVRDLIRFVRVLRRHDRQPSRKRHVRITAADSL